MCDFVNGIHAYVFIDSAASLEQVTTGHEKQVSSLMILVLFEIWKDAGNCQDLKLKEHRYER